MGQSLGLGERTVKARVHQQRRWGQGDGLNALLRWPRKSKPGRRETRASISLWKHAKT